MSRSVSRILRYPSSDAAFSSAATPSTFSSAGAVPLNFASNSALSLSASVRAAAATASSRVQSLCVGLRARPVKASGLSGSWRKSRISHSSLPSWFRKDSISAGVANPPLPLVMTLYSQTGMFSWSRATGSASQMTRALPRQIGTESRLGRPGGVVDGPKTAKAQSNS